MHGATRDCAPWCPSGGTGVAGGAAGKDSWWQQLTFAVLTAMRPQNMAGLFKSLIKYLALWLPIPSQIQHAPESTNVEALRYLMQCDSLCCVRSI